MKPSVALVSRELFPFDGGGLGRYVAATAVLLSDWADVTVFTRSDHAGGKRSPEGRDAPNLPASVHVNFVDVPADPRAAGYYGHEHAWSDAAFRALREAFPGGGPDLVEFPDYHAEGAVTVQARATGMPCVQDSLCLVRAYTPVEVCDVLNGSFLDSPEAHFRRMLERYALRFADYYVTAGGDVYDAMARFYGGHLAPGALVRHPVSWLHDQPMTPSGPDHSSDSLSILFVGRLERRKGIYELIRAITSLPPALPIRLDVVGGDTDTGPLRTSMEQILRYAVGRDDRVRFLGGQEAGRVLQLVENADLLAVPSLWECWPNTALEALRANTPILATDTGGLAELVQVGRSGWTVSPGSEGELAALIGRLFERRSEVIDLRTSGRPRQLYDELTDPDAVLASYERLVDQARSQRTARKARPVSQPSVSVILPYFRMAKFVEGTLASIRAQEYGPIECLIVVDGSFTSDDELLLNLAAKYGARIVFRENAGLSEARNFGVAVSSGDFILPLDPDDLIAPTFISSCVNALVRDPQLAYATTWARFVDELGFPLSETNLAEYRPVGNFGPGLEVENVAGTCAALIRRRVFRDGFRYAPMLTSYEDWQFYKDLAAAGLTGHVVPEPLFTYRVRARSMMRKDGAPRRKLIEAEMRAHDLNREMQWTRSND